MKIFTFQNLNPPWITTIYVRLWILEAFMRCRRNELLMGLDMKSIIPSQSVAGSLSWSNPGYPLGKTFSIVTMSISVPGSGSGGGWCWGGCDQISSWWRGEPSLSGSNPGSPLGKTLSIVTMPISVPGSGSGGSWFWGGCGWCRGDCSRTPISSRGPPTAYSPC